jgi:hypothetical protein
VHNIVETRAPDSRFPNNGQADLRECDKNYGGACVPIVKYDLDCSDVTGPINALEEDIQGFDRDKDGIGCEPYA